MMTWPQEAAGSWTSFERSQAGTTRGWLYLHCHNFLLCCAVCFAVIFIIMTTIIIIIIIIMITATIVTNTTTMKLISSCEYACFQVFDTSTGLGQQRTNTKNGITTTTLSGCDSWKQHKLKQDVPNEPLWLMVIHLTNPGLHPGRAVPRRRRSCSQRCLLSLIHKAKPMGDE